MLAHRAVNTLDAMVGRRNERYARFGTASARADDVANWPAARLAGAITVALGGSSGMAGVAQRRGEASLSERRRRRGGVRRRARAQARRHAGVRGRVEHRPELGTGREPGPDDVTRAVKLARNVALVTAALAVAWSRR